MHTNARTINYNYNTRYMCIIHYYVIFSENSITSGNQQHFFAIWHNGLVTDNKTITKFYIMNKKVFYTIQVFLYHPRAEMGAQWQA